MVFLINFCSFGQNFEHFDFYFTNKVSNYSNKVNKTNNLGVLTVVAYCSCYKCCGKWAKYNLTANGNSPKQGITCAASRKIPFNTKLNIEGVGVRIVQDRPAIRNDHKIEIYYYLHNDAKIFGVKQLRVEIMP